MQDYEQLSSYHDLWSLLNQKLLHVLMMQMERLGYDSSMPGSSRGTLFPELLPEYTRWIEHTYRILERQQAFGNLERDRVDSDWEAHVEEWSKHPEMKARVELANVMIRALPDILTGKQPATELMFPAGSMTRVEGIYKQNSIADHFNALLAVEAVQLIRELSMRGNRKVHILEVGAGTGGTSSMLFQKFEPYRQHIQEYCYTDVSKSFLQHAKKHYGPHHPYLTYSLFNIEEPLHSQGLEAGRYDLVLATNVLHATRQIRQSLRNAKALLTNNGTLLINEIIEDSLFNHVTFGLLSGWWLYEDEQVRLPGTPLLHPDHWKAALELEGYHHVQFPAANAAGLGQQIIRATSDGIVRQKRVFPSGADTQSTAGKEKSIEQQEISPAKLKSVPTLTKVDITVDDGQLKQACKSYLQKIIGGILDVEPEQIDPAEALEMYGLDSILIIQLTEQLNQNMGEHVSSVLFFEYTTLDALVDYFVDSRKAALISMLGLHNMQQDAENQKQQELQTESPTETQFNIRECSIEPAVQPIKRNEQPSLSDKTGEVAIIGLAGRYAQADDMTEFWNNLLQGKNSITEIPSERWDWQTFYHSEKGRKGTAYSRWGGFIRGIYHFDPLFFHISPKEAEQMDPQERQFLQTVYAAIEDSGYIPSVLADSGTVGVYAGVMNGNYPTGASYWSVANRVSYTFNFTGPSLAVDTACSSSLTAIHLALESLRSGTCDLAIAGGVNLIVDPVHYVRLSEKTMLSPGNQCKPFGEGADGFVDGEGVGALLLKPLHLAEADGDFIYGIMKGSMINAAGKTKGYTVPNPGQQASVVSEAITRSGVDARTISYIEAHGTGTALGDPIEVEGLRRAFAEYTDDQQFCAIGSVKSNIGHAESAAGIAGISKILLQMRHGRLVPSLHAEDSNANIRFDQTPFRVQKQASPWVRPLLNTPEGKREYPRIAGISSFGAGGANAHVIIEEYRTDNKPEQGAIAEVEPYLPVMIILSARSEERLRMKVRQLAHAMRENGYTDMHLSRIAYTLQTGREEMESRCAFTASSVQEMLGKLEAYLDGGTAHEQIYIGDIEPERNRDRLEDDDDMQELVASWIRKRKAVRLLEQWVQGMKIDWQQWYGRVKPQRISLPAYPFAEEHYVVSSSFSSIAELGDKAADSIVPVQSDWLHPLLQKNTSYLGKQRFSSFFTGNESFLNDHQVKGLKILPGAAHLEMAAAALRHSLRQEERARYEKENEDYHIRLQDLVWMHPASVDEQLLSVHLGLHAEQEKQGYKFEITGDAEAENPSMLYSQGWVSLIRSTQDKSQFNPAVWHARHGKEAVLPDHCYLAFSRLGLNYGTTHRCITHLYTGQHSVLARLEMPMTATKNLDEYLIHPSMLDSAFQTCLALAMDLHQQPLLDPEPWLPYALNQAIVYRDCPSVVWVEVGYATGSGPGQPMPRYDLALYSESGWPVARLDGLALRKWTTGSIPSENDAKLTILSPVWSLLEEEETLIDSDASKSGGHMTEGLLVLCENDAIPASHSWPAFRKLSIPRQLSVEQMTNRLAAEGECRHILWCCSTEASADRITEMNGEEQGNTTELMCLFRLIKSLLKLGYSTKSLSLTILTTNAQALIFDDMIDPDQAAIHGFAGSLAKEYAHWSIRVIDLEQGDIPRVEALLKMAPDPFGNAYVHRDEEWYRQELVPVEYEPVPQASYRQGGVYLVIGGSGGIGEAWTRYMILTYQARVVWVGRSPISPDIHSKIEILGRLGPEPIYIQADAARPGMLKRAYEHVIQQFGQVNGIIHSALVLSDRSLAYMDEEKFNDVLSAKVHISEQVNALMDQLHELPDVVMFFSSLNSFMKLPGQSNYVAACCYADALAWQMNRKWPGRIKVINWGYWGSVGSVVSEQVRQNMLQKGMGSIEAEEANPMLEWFLAGSLHQAAILKMTCQPEMLVLNEASRLTVYR
jgi:polyketide synthase PksM